MQNAPAMLAQKMMNRQAPYGPIGMVSQNMSGNKKRAAAGGAVPSGPVIGLKFDTTTATAGVTFSNSDTTATNGTGGNIASAKGNATTTTGGTSAWYWEFVVGNSPLIMMGIGPSTYTCNTTNQVGFVANTVCYYANNGNIIAGGSTPLSTGITSTTGDVIGFRLDLTASSSTLTVLKNGVVIANALSITTWIPNSATALVPIWSSNGTGVNGTISNNIYSYAGYTPIGSSVTTVAASASVPAVADGAYDVYTFNASGTFTALSTGAVRALVIAGGGSGGNYGGGGAGGYQEKGAVVTPQTYAITVGGGGGPGGNSVPGVNSSLGSVIVSTGGGAGAFFTAGNNGGSGSGADAAFPGPQTIPGGTGIVGQGFAGGSSVTVGANISSGGGGGAGGGAGGAGADATTGGGGGTGGVGIFSSITGASVGRGGGGGAAGQFYGSVGTSGGGSSSVPNGTANTGGGGSGAANALGGSGVVIIRVRARA